MIFPNPLVIVLILIKAGVSWFMAPLVVLGNAKKTEGPDTLNASLHGVKRLNDYVVGFSVLIACLISNQHYHEVALAAYLCVGELSTIPAILRGVNRLKGQL